MGKKSEESAPDQKELIVAKDASVDFPVTVIATEADPYHPTGTKFQAGSKKAKELVARGWVTMAMIALFMVASLSSFAQASVDRPLYNGTNTYTLARLLASTVESDTVTNTGVGVLTTKRVTGTGAVTIQVNVTKVSGTVGGTISLQGSLDGTNFKALNTEETQTALATITATDASNVYHWRLSKSPFLYYRVSWTGTGTMVATFTSRILKH